MPTETTKWYRNRLNVAVLIIGTVLIGYVSFTFINDFLSLSGLQETILSQARNETKRRSITLGSFFAERKADVESVASSTEVLALLDQRSTVPTKSQIIPLRIIPANHFFTEFLNKKKIGGNPIYTRIAYFDETGNILVEATSTKHFTDAKSEFKPQPVQTAAAPVSFHITGRRDIQISKPCFRQDVYLGQIVVWMRSNIIYDYILRDEQSKNQKTFMVSEGKEILRGGAADPYISSLPDLTNVETDKPFEFASVTGDNVQRKSYAVKYPIKDTPFSLISIVAAIEVYGPLSSWHVLFWIIVLVLIIFVGSIYILTLKARLKDAVRREKSLEDRSSQLAAEVERRTDFLSMLANELRTPLSSVLIFSENVSRKLDETIFPQVNREDEATGKTIGRIQDNLKVMVSEGRRLSSLIGNILDIAKMEAGKMDWLVAPVAVNDIVKQAALATASLFEQRGIQFAVEVEASLPDIPGDRDRLIQALINLFTNAVKFTEQGSVTCRVKKQGNDILVSVADTGIGIDKKDQERIFEKFRQGNGNVGNKWRGTGLGLPITKQIIERHGGRIWVDSEPGSGSTFTFTLPMQSPKET
jgi:signal transduction histidine kinase